MPSRRFHHKSRHGCANCKQRKIRCAEERPSCANCNRLGGRCSFLDSDPRGGAAVQSSPESSSSTPRTSAPDAHSPDTKGDVLDQYDQEFIQRWSEATCFTMNDELEKVPMWQVTVPSIALQHPFLRHGLLALSSMHVRYTSPLPLRSKYLDLASQHQAKALAGYIPELQTVTPENCHALFAFSALLLSIQYSFISAMEEDVAEDLLSETISVFDYVIGATVIASQGAIWLRQGGLDPLMTRRTPPENILLLLPEEPREALSTILIYVEHLRQVASSTLDSDMLAKIPVYVRSIEMLTNAFSAEGAERRNFDDMIGWPHFVGGEFVRLLKDRDPISLVILAHYGVALSTFNDFWWLEGVGARLIRAISHVLDNTQFSALIQWPLGAVTIEQVISNIFIG